MEKRDYNLELIRIEFMDGISQIPTEAWESQKPAALEISLGQVTEEQRKQHYKNMDDIVLLTQRWWVEKQSEFVSKLIADYKSNIFFRQIAQNSEKDLNTINQNLKNQNFLTAIFTNKIVLIGNNKLDDKFRVLSDLVNRCFTLKDDTYKVEDENISLVLRVGLLDDLLTSYLSGDYGYSEKIDDKFISKYQYKMINSYFSFLPMHFITGADMNPKLDLTYFTKYFECYCKFINKLLRISSEPRAFGPKRVPPRPPIRVLIHEDEYKNGGSKKTRKHRK
jgi:hypothetical protein